MIIDSLNSSRNVRINVFFYENSLIYDTNRDALFYEHNAQTRRIDGDCEAEVMYIERKQRPVQ